MRTEPSLGLVDGRPACMTPSGFTRMQRTPLAATRQGSATPFLIPVIAIIDVAVAEPVASIGQSILMRAKTGVRRQLTSTLMTALPMPISAAPEISPAQIGSSPSTQNSFPGVPFCG
jgi:hypothetical protein